MEYLFIALGLLLLAGAYTACYRWMWCGWKGLYERATEAADVGDTQGLRRLFDRLRTRAARDPETPGLELLAGGCIVAACEREHPSTAQALLDHLGLKRPELLWQEAEGKPPVPLREWVQGQPDFERSCRFLQQED